MDYFVPGTFFVVRTSGWAAPIIRGVTRSEVNHAGIILDTEGRTMEAQPKGADFGRVDNYKNDVLYVANLNLMPAVTVTVVENAIKLKGRGYGWLDIASIGLLQYGIKPAYIRDIVEESSYLICSQLVDYDYDLSNVHLFTDKRLPMDVTPGDLYGLRETGVHFDRIY